MKRENISNWSLIYLILKTQIKLFFNRYFRKITIVGKENITYNEPIIFAPIHQNALSDPFAVLFNVKYQPVFMARADIFNKPLLIKILTTFKILPIYRIRDGRSSLQNNDEMFEYAIRVLEKKKNLIILPEGGHAMAKKLRDLKKGICRIAFQAEERNNYNLGLKIIPVGIEYEHYTKFFKTLLVNFGKPIEIKKYYELYKKNSAQAINDLRNELASDLKKLIIHIDSSEYYELYDELRNIYKYRMKEWLALNNLNQPNKFIADKKLIECLDKELADNEENIKILSEKTKEYTRLIGRLNLRNWIIEKGKFSWVNIFLHFLYILLFLPAFLYGFLNNILPYIIPVKLSNKLFKDPAYWGSARSIGAAYLFPIFYILQFFLVKSIFNDYRIALIYLVSLPIFGYYTLFYSFSFKKLSGKLRYKSIVNKAELISLRDNIIESTDAIVKKYISI